MQTTGKGEVDQTVGALEPRSLKLGHRCVRSGKTGKKTRLNQPIGGRQLIWGNPHQRRQVMTAGIDLSAAPAGRAETWVLIWTEHKLVLPRDKVGDDVGPPRR